MMWNGLCPFWNSGAWGTWGWIGMALNLFFWLALIVGTIYLARSLVARLGSSTRGISTIDGMKTSVQIAQERYARGEIQREEYLKLMDDLK